MKQENNKIIKIRNNISAAHFCRMLLIYIICIGSLSLFSCKAHSGRADARQAQRAKQAKAREGQRAYRKAYKRHLNMQDKTTKKRMKTQIKQQKKIYKESEKKNGKKTACSNKQV